MFATGLICLLAGAIAGILFANHFTERRLIASFEDGRKLERNIQREKDSARAQKAARTRLTKKEVSNAVV